MPPIRTCAGCGRKAPKGELVRFVVANGLLAYDPTGGAPGRGVYTCREPACFEAARTRRALARTLRRPVEIPARLQGVWQEG